MKNILEKLVETPSVSGYEVLMCELIKNQLSGIFEEIKTDALGNLICHKKGIDTKKVFVCHMDNPGLVATYFEGDKVKVSALGNIASSHAAFRPIRFFSGERAILIPPNGFNSETKVSDFTAHLGDVPQKEILQGTKAYFENAIIYLSGDYISAFSLSTLIPLACVIEAAKKAVFSSSDVYFVFTVQEKLGARGISSALFKIQPDEVYNIRSSNLHKSSDSKTAGISSGLAINMLGKGFSSSKILTDKIQCICKENDIAFALFTDTSEISDTTAACNFGAGSEVCEICIPIDNFGSACEMAKLSDAECVQKLITELVK